MIRKELIRPERLRQVPAGFGWIDHRLVRHNYVSRCDCRALALYLFLITVSDVQGLSYYSESALCRRLGMALEQLRAARRQLIQADLIAYRKPFYQVLSLPEPGAVSSPSSQRSGQTESVGEILRRALGREGSDD